MGFDMRAGTVISMASVHDADADLWRRVLYRGFASEIFVPYMDPEEEWYFHTFMDAGEYGLGVSAVPLQPEADYPANAAYMDGYYVDADGKPVKSENIICVFEVRRRYCMAPHRGRGTNRTGDLPSTPQVHAIVFNKGDI